MQPTPQRKAYIVSIPVRRRLSSRVMLRDGNLNWNLACHFITVPAMLRKAPDTPPRLLTRALAQTAVSTRRNGFRVVDTDAHFPYYAYNDQWSCPLPPRENRLAVRIEAGEKTFNEDETDAE
jgi:Protein of unknown function (DUF1684)